MRKFIRRSLVGLAAVIAAGVVLSAVAAAMFKGTPAWYRATVDAKPTDAQREQLAHAAESKMIEAQNWAATVRADAQRAQRTVAGSRPSPLAARADASHVIEFTDAELNALFDKWSTLYGWRDNYAAYLEDPRIVLRDDRLIFAGRLRELGAVASFQFRPHLDEAGQLKLDLVRVSGGRLPLPEGVWVKWRDQIVESARKNTLAWRARANVDPSGAANFPMMAATLSRLLFAVSERRAAEPVLFLPLAGQRDSVPVKVTDVKVETGKLRMVVEPLSASERVALLERVRSGTSGNAQAAGE